MPKRSPEKESPPCYVMVHAGLEEVAGEEIAHDFAGEVKKTSPGVVVFRVPEISRSLLRLKTTEDLFVFAWGTDQLTYRAEDLEKIRRWTDREADWARLLQIHHAIRPKPKGKPTYRLVVQMNGTHGYRRIDARKALARGLAGKLPASWHHAEENAAIEIWLTIDGATAVCGVRLSDRSMRHRTYKFEHLPASLRPTLAAAMVRLAEIRPGQTIVDPMCGAGTLLAETWLTQPRRAQREETASRERQRPEDTTSRERQRPEESGEPKSPTLHVLGGDIDGANVRAAEANLHLLGPTTIKRWDARKLPLEDASVDRILCNPPFGKQLSTPAEIGPLYRQTLKEMDRILKPAGRAVLLVADLAALREAVQPLAWKQLRLVNVRILGLRGAVVVYRKSGG